MTLTQLREANKAHAIIGSLNEVLKLLNRNEQDMFHVDIHPALKDKFKVWVESQLEDYNEKFNKL